MTRTYADGIEDALTAIRRAYLTHDPADQPDPDCGVCTYLRKAETAIRTLFPSPSGIEDARGADGEEDYQLGKRDGRSDAVQEIDLATGGDGEYRYCTDHDPERHCPDPEAMIARIVGRFSDAREALTGWRLIEDGAPEDGTPVRLYDPEEDYGEFGSSWEAHFQEDEGWVAAVWLNHQDSWATRVIKPTHWMPLPAPPLCESASSKIGGDHG